MKSFLTAVALCVAMSAFAQVEKGRSYITGQLSFRNPDQTYHQHYKNNNLTNDNLSRSKAFNGSLGYGYLIATGWAIGLRADYSVSKENDTATTNGFTNTTTLKGNGYVLAGYVRKYFLIADKFYLHLDGGVSYSNGSSQSKDGTGNQWDKDSSETLSVYVAPGLTYFLSKRLALTANMGSISYNKQDQTNNTNEYASTAHKKYWDFSPRLNSISLGVSVYF